MTRFARHLAERYAINSGSGELSDGIKGCGK